jgi:PAS domain S-box-containing protein
MQNAYVEKKRSISIKTVMKLLSIIAFWESLIMLTLYKIGHMSPLLENTIDTICLTLFSGLSIWFLIMQPEEKKLKKAHSSSMHLLGQEINAINDIAIISATDLSGKIIYANDNFCKIAGFSREELLMKDHRIVNSGLHPKEVFKEMWTTIESGKPWRGRVRNKKKNGDFYWVDAYIVPIFNDEGVITKYVSFRFDVTAEKIAEEALEQEKIKNTQLARLSAIGEMAAGIAHEINNPLTIVNGMLVIVEHKLHSENIQEEIPKITANVQKIQTQVNLVTKVMDGLREFLVKGSLL